MHSTFESCLRQCLATVRIQWNTWLCFKSTQLLLCGRKFNKYLHVISVRKTCLTEKIVYINSECRYYCGCNEVLQKSTPIVEAYKQDYVCTYRNTEFWILYTTTLADCWHFRRINVDACYRGWKFRQGLGVKNPQINISIQSITLFVPKSRLRIVTLTFQ